MTRYNENGWGELRDNYYGLHKIIEKKFGTIDN